MPTIASEPTAPTAVANLVSVATGLLPAGFNVQYDTNTGRGPNLQVLLISGIRFSEDEPATMSPAYSHEEHYTITCALCSSAGDTDEAGRMTEVYGYYNAIWAALTEDPTITGAVRESWTRQIKYTPGHDANGRSVGLLTFEVECQARVQLNN